jgi:hypothetical protein
VSYERRPMRCFTRFANPDKCRMCPTASAVTAIGRAAIDALRPEYDERQSHVAAGDRSLWVTQASDARLRSEDPRYAELISAYETAYRSRSDMNVTDCPGGTIDRPPEGPATYTCNYQPSPGAPELAVPPGTSPLPPGK